LSWIRFFLRTVTPGQELVPKERTVIVAAWPALTAFIEWVLNRDPERRPCLNDVKKRFKDLRGQLTSKHTGDRMDGSEKLLQLSRLPCAKYSSVVPPHTRHQAFAKDDCKHHIEAYMTSNSLPSNCAASPGFPKQLDLQGFFKPLVTLPPWFPFPDKMTFAFVDCSAIHDELSPLMLGDVGILSCPAMLRDAGIVAVLECRYKSSNSDHESQDVTPTLPNVVTQSFILPSKLNMDNTTSADSTLDLHDEIFDQSSIAITSALLFLRHALLQCVAGAPRRRRACNAPRVLITARAGDASVALVAAAALHMHMYGKGLYAASVALRKASCAAAICLEPYDARHLIAWEARIHASIGMSQGLPRFCCPRGCWHVALVGAPSAQSIGCNMTSCGATLGRACDPSCIGYCMGIVGGCRSVLDSITMHGGHYKTLLWAHVTADQLSPSFCCARAVAANNPETYPVLSGFETRGSGLSYDEQQRRAKANMEISYKADMEISCIGEPEHGLDLGWMLYKCSCCGCATHAAKCGEYGPSRRIAVIANMPAAGAL